MFWMLFHIPLRRAQSSLAEEVDGDVTYYDSEEADGGRGTHGAADLGIRNLGIMKPEQKMYLESCIDHPI